jgi:CRP/FNR family transcriptional regulator
MHASHDLNIQRTCLDCAVREDHLFCNLPIQTIQRLNQITATAVYPTGATLFIEGQQPRGAFVLCGGKVKLSISSHGGKTIITNIPERGEVLGLNAVISNRPYEVTAEMMESGQVNFIPRDSLLQLLKDDSEVGMHVAAELSRNYYAAHEEIRTLGLTASLSERLAKLLLSWSDKTMPSDDSSRVKITLTHGEIGEAIGTSRESVSRLLSEFKQKQLIEVKGSTLVIRNRKLEKIIQS